MDTLNYTYERLFSNDEANKYFASLEEQIVYMDDPKVVVYGKSFKIPRKVAAYGDGTYTFSGLQCDNKPWIPILLEIKERVEKVAKTKFNYVLINRYNDGNDHIGAHKDNEKGLEHPIACVSFGATRKLSFTRKKFPTKSVMLENGSLLIMHKPTNDFWFHKIPKEKKVLLPRISLTFRKIF